MQIRQSIGRAGSALDNAVIESWHSTLEFELPSLEHFATKGHQALGPGRGLDRRVQPRPRHSALQMRSPISYELYLPAGTEAELPASDSTACTVLAGVKARAVRCCRERTPLQDQDPTK